MSLLVWESRAEFSSCPVASWNRSLNRRSFSSAMRSMQLGVAQVSCNELGHQNDSSLLMIRALIGSFWIARLSAPRAVSSSG